MPNPYQQFEKYAKEDIRIEKISANKGFRDFPQFEGFPKAKKEQKFNFTKRNKPMRQVIYNAIYIIALLLLASFSLYAARIKDIAAIEGVSGVQVIGYGLVTGLNNTGDNQQTSFTVQSVSNLLKNFGLTVPQLNPRVRNVAAVIVTTTIPPFLKKGSKVDIQVSSIGDATSIQGGVLLMTPVLTKEGAQIGLAQGGVSVGGYDYQSMGARVGRNFVTSGRVPNGLILENPPPTAALGQQINIVLFNPDFTTATNVSRAINSLAGLANTANATDAATIQVNLPTGQPLTTTIAAIEIATVVTDVAARVVINERTGTVVVGGNVILLPAVVSHGGLEVQIQKNVVIPQPAPFTIRPPHPVETAQLNVSEDLNPSQAIEIPPGATVQDISTALNTLKVKPRDLIAIFQALKEAGSLQGELIIQ